jgi:hypothetical protein
LGAYAGDVPLGALIGLVWRVRDGIVIIVAGGAVR